MSDCLTLRKPATPQRNKRKELRLPTIEEKPEARSHLYLVFIVLVSVGRRCLLENTLMLSWKISAWGFQWTQMRWLMRQTSVKSCKRILGRRWGFEVWTRELTPVIIRLVWLSTSHRTHLPGGWGPKCVWHLVMNCKTCWKHWLLAIIVLIIIVFVFFSCWTSPFKGLFSQQTYEFEFFQTILVLKECVIMTQFSTTNIYIWENRNCILERIIKTGVALT